MSKEKIYGYGKEQKLKSRKLIDTVFKEGKSIAAFPLRLYYLKENPHFPMQAGVGVSKRHFPLAVDRNRIKRVMREAWRLQKSELQNKIIETGLKLSVFINYMGKELPAKDVVTEALKKCLQKLEKEIFPENES